MTSLAREEELAALIAAQSADDQWGHRVRSLSLDADMPGGEVGTFHEVHGSDDASLVALVRNPRDDSSLRRVPRPQAWTRRQIVSAIRAWVKEHGELPYYTDWNRPNGRGIPSAASIARHFGSWSKGMRAAGFEPRPVGGLRNLHPGSEKARPRVRQRRRSARLSSEAIAAAYVLYDRQGLSVPQLAERLYEKYGYATPRLCQQALWQGFHADGFKVRSKSEARMNLTPDHRRRIAAKAGLARAALTMQQAREIRMSRATQVALAERYGVSQSTISRIKRRKSYGPALHEVAA